MRSTQRYSSGNTPNLHAPPFTVPPPRMAPASYRIKPKDLPYPPASPCVPQLPGNPIPPPAVSAIISSNKRSVVDRKLRRKAETHKTIPCRAWNDTGRCNYGTRCKFAHGEEDLRRLPEERPKLFNNPRYRTELCAKYHYLGSCPYGERCSYIHEPTPKIDLEKCLDELALPASPGADKENSLTAKSHLNVLEKPQSCRPTKTNWTQCENDFRDPFASADGKEDIELKFIPFMESFLRRPFHVR